jgi:hypothetical protein
MSTPVNSLDIFTLINFVFIHFSTSNVSQTSFLFFVIFSELLNSSPPHCKVVKFNWCTRPRTIYYSRILLHASPVSVLKFTRKELHIAHIGRSFKCQS